MDTFQLLRGLTEAPGPSGFESAAATHTRDLWEPLVDRLHVSIVGSLVAIKDGSGPEPRPSVMLAAHLDEIGLMVKQLVAFPDEESGHGFLKVTNVGGVDVRQLYAQTVVVHGSASGTRDLAGVIGALPAGMLSEDKRGKPFGYDELVVDVGMSYSDLKGVISVGDFISFRQPLRKLVGKRVTGKALDNRASVAAITVCLDYLAHRQHEWDVIAVATAQEETTFLGAYTSAYAQAPDVAVAIDVTFGKGPGSKDSTTYELGGGPTIGLGSNFHPGVHNALKKTADALEMKVHVDPIPSGSGTDAFALQISREGIPTGLVSIPLRYMHTMVETIDPKDMERAGRLLGEFVTRLDGTFLDDISKQMMDEKAAS